MNRLYPNSRRESGNENQYLNTLPAEGGWRKKRPDENETKIRYAGRNGGAQGRGLNSPKNAFEEHQNAIGIEKLRNFFFFAAGMKERMETARQNLQPEQSWRLKQEPALITDPNSDVGKCI
ncbi:hypothetical protein TNCV_1098151 [Trichonephila clavipes]|nr:hypothetical protein TNCV_1098151 [Trichonephila clavipes]